MFRVLTCLAGEHDLRLVVLAGIVCFLASVTAINLFHRACSTRGGACAAWIITAGAAAGCGIWATHFIAMLAYDPGITTAYDIGLTALSLVAAAGVTGAGLGVAVYSPARWSAPVGGGIVGAGIACMHYLGMWALEVPGRVTWWFDLVLVSIALGMLFGMGALVLAVRRSDMRGTAGAALLLTLAIVAHHFTAMGAVEILPDPTRAITAFSFSPTALAAAVAGGAIAVLGMSLIGAIADRRLADRTDEFDQHMGARQRIIEQTKEELDRLNRGLERLVEERTADLQAVRSFLEATLENVTQGIMMIDADRRVPVCNRRAMELLELPADMMASRPRWDEVLAFLRRTGVFEEALEQVDACRLTENIQSYQIRRPTGAVIEVHSVPLAGGGRVHTFTDVTELLTNERLSVLGRLTATVAHELRNPLSAINNTTAALRQAALSKNIDFERPISRIERSIGRCDQLVSDLLEYARRRNLVLKPAKLDQWLSDVLDEQLIPDGMVLERQLAAKDTLVALDDDRFRRVVINLIDNATEAMQQTRDRERKISVQTRTNDCAEIIVRDTGPGISPDVLPKIFEPLFSTKSYGTGLGLPTVKQIIEQHEGRVEVASELGQGTAVHIKLPLAAAERIAA